MIDDKKIEYAANKYIETKYARYNSGYVKEEMICIMCKDSFKEGAKWAINKFLKNLWHPSSEEPKKGATIIYENHSKNGNTYFYIESIECLLDSFNSWSNFIKFMSVPRWLYMDDLFNKEGGEHD